MEFIRKNIQSNIEELYKIFLENPIITTDSRSIDKESIFFALKGENFNGNMFSKNALENGASYSIIDQEEYYIDNRTILVDNVLKTLQSLANYHRNQFKELIVLAITGTNGKTTTKELVNTILSKKYNTIATLGNYNNHIGLPLTLLKIQKQNQIAIIEMGANHIGEIEELCNIAEPNYGIITNIGKAHLEGFGSFENIIKTKLELFTYLDNANHFPIINMDDPNLKRYYSTHKNKVFTYHTESINKYNTACIEFENRKVKSNLIGNYNNENIMAAMVIGKIFSVGIEDSINAIENYIPSNHRSQIKETKTNTLVLDCYNANPSSVKAAILDFINDKHNKKTICLGAMRELGLESVNEHKKIINIISKGNFDKVFLVGEEFKNLDKSSIKNHYWFHTSLELRDYLIKYPIINSKILIKGSRTTKMEAIGDVL